MDFERDHLQLRDYRQAGFNSLGKVRLAELFERDITGLLEWLANRYNRVDLATDATRNHYEKHVKAMMDLAKKPARELPFNMLREKGVNMFCLQIVRCSPMSRLVIGRTRWI